MIVLAAVLKLVAKVVGRADRRTWLWLAAVLAVAATQARLVFDVAIRLSSCPLDPEVDILTPRQPIDAERIAAALDDAHILVVGGTRGIGRGIASEARRLGTAASVSVVGRTKLVEPSSFDDKKQENENYNSGRRHVAFRSYAADISTVAGCRALAAQVGRGLDDDAQFDFVFFTVATWPDSDDAFTADGVERVVALDLLARHVVFTALADARLLRPGARIVNTLASTQHFPLMSRARVVRRLSSRRAPGSLFSALLPVAVAADAYLRAAAYHYPDYVYAGTFPGVVDTDVARPTFKSDWLYALYKAATRLIAITETDAGLIHLAIATAPNLRRRKVSYWNHLLEGRRAHVVAYDPALITFVWDFLVNLTATHSPPQDDVVPTPGPDL